MIYHDFITRLTLSEWTFNFIKVFKLCFWSE